MKDKDINSIIKKNAELSAHDLAKRSSILSEAVTKGELKILPAYYHLDSGKVEFMNT